MDVCDALIEWGGGVLGKYCVFMIGKEELRCLPSPSATHAGFVPEPRAGPSGAVLRDSDAPHPRLCLTFCETQVTGCVAFPSNHPHLSARKGGGVLQLRHPSVPGGMIRPPLAAVVTAPTIPYHFEGVLT